ncbi:MAG: ACP S-malonyltransferase [Candidatus Nanopelagicaceae bacterium]|nr:ACP S-malonyltransferase [Candidatus Nanopelagicaceae bacterium]
MLAIVAPGQGSQTPGFLSPWLEDFQLKSALEEFSESIGLDLVYLGTLANADEIRDTANAQPLIVSAGLLGMKSLGGINFSITAGHSVGEITAATIAGVMSELDAMRLVRERGQAMARAASETPTGMSAVLGGEREDVIAALTSLGLVGANENGAGQIVAAGKLDALAALEANPPVGTRVRALAVAGAFHTEVMAPAVGQLREFAKGVLVSDPRVAILSNREGAVVTTGREVLDRIVNQIANPVRWDLCMEAMKALGVTAVIELPPAGTLIGLIKRALPGVETVALKTPSDLDAARDLIARHSENS